MKYDVQISAQAEADLRSIYTYIAYELLSPQSAIGQLNRLETAIYSLDEMPERCRAYEKEPWHSRGLRVMVVDKYLVFYIPKRETQTVYIVRVMYSSRDIDTEWKRFKGE